MPVAIGFFSALQCFITALVLSAGPAWAQSGSSAGVYGDIIEQTISEHESRLDVSGPESAGLVALGLEPFLTALPVAPPDLAANAVAGSDERGHTKVSAAIDVSPFALIEGNRPLNTYQRSKIRRALYRVQFSLAVSQAAFDDNEGARIAPALRLTFHNRRDPRVHRGPGSLLNCLFERSTPPPPDWEARLATLSRELAQLGTSNAITPSERNLLVAEQTQLHEQLSLWAETEVHKSIAACRNEIEVASYGWNATGLAGGLAPIFTTRTAAPRGPAFTSYAAWLTGAYGFDPNSDTRGYTTTWWAAHVQTLAQIMYQRNDRISLPAATGEKRSAQVNRLTLSTRLRGGVPNASGSLELALVHEERSGIGDTVFSRVTIGGDFRVARGTWLTVSAGRTISRSDRDQTTIRVALKWTPLGEWP